MFRHRLFGIKIKPTNTVDDQTGTQAPAQAGIEDFLMDGGFQRAIAGLVDFRQSGRVCLRRVA